jgi:hypothetical protein
VVVDVRPYVCDVAVEAAVSVKVAPAVPPTWPEPGRTAETPLLTVIVAAVARSTVVELIVLVTDEDKSPEPVAVTTVVVAVAVESASSK